MSVPAVFFEVIADRGIRRHLYVLIEDGAANLRSAADVAVVEDDGILDERTGMYAHASSQHRIAHPSAGEDRSAGDDRVDGLAAALVLIEGELRGRVGIAVGPQRPLAVIEIQRRFDGAQIHIGFPVSLDRADVAPVGLRAVWFAG